MDVVEQSWKLSLSESIRARWEAHCGSVMRVANVLLAMYAAGKLGDEFRRLLFQYDFHGAIDLRGFQGFTQGWFAGIPIYLVINNAAYPPASYVLGYPFVGWLDFTAARWLWAATSIVALVVLAILLVRASLATSRVEKVFVVLMLLAMNSTGVTIGNGQRILHLLPAILASLALLYRESRTLLHELGGSALYLFALIQPAITVPFGWLVLFSPRGWRPVAVIGTAYVALTVFAKSFQSASLDTLLKDWIALSSFMASSNGYGNLSIWLADLGLAEWSLAASLLVLLGLGLWLYTHRSVDRWVLIGVTALVARFWVYHMLYDDVLVVLAMLALFRIAKQESENTTGIIAGMLLAVNVLAMLFLANWLILPAPWHFIFVGGHTVVWLIDLIFLVGHARQQRSWSSVGAA